MRRKLEKLVCAERETPQREGSANELRDGCKLIALDREDAQVAKHEERRHLLRTRFQTILVEAQLRQPPKVLGDAR